MSNQMQDFKPEFVKFDWEQVSSEVPMGIDVIYIRDVCNELDKYGLVAPYKTPEGVGSNGNVSYRFTSNGQFVVTATQLPSKRDLNGSDFVVVHKYELPIQPTDRGTAFYSGQKLPSSESILHWYFYHKNSIVGGIIHAHEDTELLYSPRSRAVWRDSGIIETVRVGEEGTIDLPKSVEEALTSLWQYTILMNHHPSWDEVHTGVLVMDKTLHDALAKTVNIHNELVKANRAYPSASTS